PLVKDPEPDALDVNANQFRRRTWTTTRHRVDDIEKLENICSSQDQDDRDSRQHEGKLHSPKDLPPFFRLETCGFLDFERDHRQARKQDERAKGSPLPILHYRDREKGEGGTGEP